VLKAETTRPPAATAGGQQRRFRAFCREYNEVRPHESLQDEPPARHYQVSSRALPTRLPPIEYPGHMEVRRVSSAGCISWFGTPIFLTEVLGGEYVALEEVADGRWTLSFGSVRLGRLDDRTRTITALPPPGGSS